MPGQLALLPHCKLVLDWRYDFHTIELLEQGLLSRVLAAHLCHHHHQLRTAPHLDVSGIQSPENVLSKTGSRTEGMAWDGLCFVVRLVTAVHESDQKMKLQW